VHEHDHAVVVGIRRYGDSVNPSKWIRDLEGPDNDAQAIAAWLRKPDGGGLPDENVRVVSSAEAPDPFPPGGAAPQQYAVEAALTDVAFLPPSGFRDEEEGRTYAGRRLYVYVAGHGFAKRVDETALITAEALERRPLNVLITSWLDWYHQAAHFKELVLWVDTCASNVPVAYLKGCDLTVSTGSSIGSARRFYVYAAELNKQAVENKMADGKWHGVFTYALLQGLEGGVAGKVTSESLRDYLRNNMKSFMRPEQRVNAVSQEPAFGPVDPMDFGVEGTTRAFAVTLRFPDRLKGKKATVSVDASTVLAETELAGPEWKLELEAGAYVAFVPDSGEFGAFAVTGDNTGAIDAIQ
jgi:uncharacterized caspase-like protein